MLIKQKTKLLAIVISFGSLFISGCGFFTPAPKPDVGPAGKPVEAKSNPPFMERFQNPPTEMYDMEALAGAIFEGIMKPNLSELQGNLSELDRKWQMTKGAIGDKKGVKEANEALLQLNTAISAKDADGAYENLIKFMGSLSDVGKSYKLSPAADIIGLGNSIRNVSFYVDQKDWKKATAKIKELQNIWQQAKPSVEQFGILGEATRTHSLINQLKDSIEAENQASAKEHIANLNESVGYIRQYFRGK